MFQLIPRKSILLLSVELWLYALDTNYLTALIVYGAIANQLFN